MTDVVSINSIVQGEGYQIGLARMPDECPRCHQGIDPRCRFGTLLTRLPAKHIWAQLGFQCPRENCRRLFLALYGYVYPYEQTSTLEGTHVFELLEVSPRSPIERTFPKRIADLSPRFPKIYNQAAAAEDHELGEIAGPGYRKALEFLIKDYLVSLFPSDAAAIKATFLGRLIQDRVTDANIKSVAERATWLGNDETHYERRWEKNDINDLKKLIGLTVYWVDSELLTKEMVASMPPAKKAK
jgi:hypothetical protein